MSKRRNLTIWIAIIFLPLWALLTHSHPYSWNDNARMATVEALVHQGTWAIDNTVFGGRTGDRIFWNGHFYSDKPPVLSFLAAGVYAVLHKGFHISFDFVGWCDPVDSPCYCFALLCGQPDWAYTLLTLALMGVPSALMLALFYRATALLDLSDSAALLVTGALGLGTLVFPLSLVFNNHLPTAASLLLGFYALLRARAGGAAAARWLALAGFATALAFTVDLLVVPFLAAFLGFALIRYRLRVWPFLLGSLVPLALLAALDWWMLGDPLPPSMHPSGFAFRGSIFATTLTGNTPPVNVLEHGYQMLLGDQGLFSLNPVMLWPVLGLWLLFRSRHHRLWGEMVAGALGVMVTLVCLILFTPGTGGVSYGTRWLLDFVPLLFFFAAWPTLYRSWRRWIFVALAIVSIFSACHGALKPWGWSPTPLGFVKYVTSPIGHYLERLPDDMTTYTTTDRPRYLPVDPMHVWHTSLRRFEPAVGALPAGIPDRPAIYVLSADDQATADWLATTFPQGRWDLTTPELAVYRVPADVERVHPAQPLRAEFAGQVRVLGCDPSPTSLRPGDTVTVRLYWQALVRMYPSYTVFVHLLGPTNPATGGPLWAQDDHQPGSIIYMTDRWLPGEIVLDRFQFTVPADTPPGEYTVTTGFYDPLTLQRLPRSDAEGDTATLFSITVTP